MDTSIETLLTMRREHVARTGSLPRSPSDWNCESEQLSIPSGLLDHALEESRRASDRYYFTRGLPEIEELFWAAAPVAREGVEVTFVASATAAIASTLEALDRMGLRRCLFVTPNYFSGLETMRQRGMTVVFHHLDRSNQFRFDLDALTRDLRDQYIDFVLVCDPVFCIGRGIEQAEYDRLAELCNRFSAVLVCDHALGGVEWHSPRFESVPEASLAGVRAAERAIFIDSPTKRMLVNGVKFATVITKGVPIDLGPILDRSLGGLQAIQVCAMAELYSQRHEEELDSCHKRNIDAFRSNDVLLSAISADDSFERTECSSGYFTMLWAPARAELDPLRFIEDALTRDGVFLIPASHFCFGVTSGFGIRVNLAKPPALVSEAGTLLARALA